MPTTGPAWSKDLATLRALQEHSEAQASSQLRQLIEPNGISVASRVHGGRPTRGRSVCAGAASVLGVLVVIALYVLIVLRLSAAMP